MKLFERGYIKAIAVSYLALMLFGVVTSMVGSEVPTERARRIVKSTIPRFRVGASEILAHNLLATWFLVIPIIGLAPFTYIMYNTGYSIGAFAKNFGLNPVFVTLMCYGVNSLEVLAYSLLVGQGIYLIYLTHKGEYPMAWFQFSHLKLVSLYILLLFAGAVLEAKLIR